MQMRSRNHITSGGIAQNRPLACTARPRDLKIRILREKLVLESTGFTRFRYKAITIRAMPRCQHTSRRGQYGRLRRRGLRATPDLARPPLSSQAQQLVHGWYGWCLKWSSWAWWRALGGPGLCFVSVNVRAVTFFAHIRSLSAICRVGAVP